MKILSNIFFALVLLAIACPSAFSQNPIVRDQFTADPSARVFNGKIYVFPSHDIIAPEGKGLRENWFCMEDYHVFSSENLTDWTDHGMIVSQYDVEWVDSNSYSMWAPDCVERNGKYYFYFPSNVKPDGEAGRRGGFGIGVAIADAPEGPYVPEKKPIQGINGIDPCVLIDDDGQAYIYWSMGNIYGAKLKENMLELDSETTTIAEMPRAGMKEGPWVFKRNGLYYMTLPHVENDTERLEYGISDNPLGPFEMKGVIMDESPTGCWTNHHSILEYNDQWYLFYHHNDYSPDFDKNRSIRADSLFFNSDGTIQKVIPTLRGIGLASAESQIQLDRYTDISENAAIDFLNPENTFDGWKTIFKSKGDWIRFNTVDFSNKKLKNAKMRVRSESGGKVQIKFSNKDESVLAEVEIPKSDEWILVDSKIEKYKKGTYDLMVELISGNNVEIDWVQFAK